MKNIQSQAPHHQKSRTAFTLIELSIVLVIIGLIVGGVLVGQDLIKAAELRKVVSDVEKFKTAANTFRLKYNCLPGDCPNAYTFFGAGCGTNVDINTNEAGCNGNGDKRLTNASVSTNTCEHHRLWHHLSLADLIEGDYDGVQVGGFHGYSPGNNCPRFAAGKDGCFAGWNAVGTSDFHGYVGDTLIAGALQTSTNYPQDPLIIPQDAWSIDSKMDDGLATTGKVRSYHAVATASCRSGSAYAVTTTTKLCAPMFTWDK